MADAKVVYRGAAPPSNAAGETLFNIMEENRKAGIQKDLFKERSAIEHGNRWRSKRPLRSST